MRGDEEEGKIDMHAPVKNSPVFCRRTLLCTSNCAKLGIPFQFSTQQIENLLAHLIYIHALKNLVALQQQNKPIRNISFLKTRLQDF